jgi:hypothetical protein
MARQGEQRSEPTLAAQECRQDNTNAEECAAIAGAVRGYGRERLCLTKGSASCGYFVPLWFWRFFHAALFLATFSSRGSWAAISGEFKPTSRKTASGISRLSNWRGSTLTAPPPYDFPAKARF